MMRKCPADSNIKMLLILNDRFKNINPKGKRDPDKISNPDEKAVAVLMNAYENIDGAEELYAKFRR
jgi:hypothetical protein